MPEIVEDQIATKPVVLMPEGLYQWEAFSDRVPYTRETWRVKMDAGMAPKPIRLSARCTVWRGADILAWLADPLGYKASD
ncbi:transcriptional regulator [Pigmentiphaga daeguensis]|uniref:Transcriptional regulator, AlpA family n=1 Tax=Pigmentiphaga daeguensis TaxID=414049 RepID=A0ABN1BA46_9BURK